MAVELPVTPEWRDRMVTLMRAANLTTLTLARAAGTSQAAVSYVLTKARASSLVPVIEGVLVGAPTAPDPDAIPREIVTAEVAAMREARDAIENDIVRLESARAAIEERLVEAYEHRAKLDIRIRELRAGRQR